MVIRTAVLGSVSRAGVLGLATLSVGCAAVGPDFQKPEVETAEAWLQAEDERVDSSRAEYEDWWKVFEDPALDRLIDHAYNENLGLQVAGLRILEARAQLGFATGLKYPQSQSVGASYVRSKSSENAPPFSNLPDDVLDRIDTSVNVWSTSFDIAWEADVWGKFRRGVEAADANLAANMLNYDAVLVSLTGDVAMTYATIRTLEQRLAYVRKNVVLQEQGLEIAETRFTANPNWQSPKCAEPSDGNAAERTDGTPRRTRRYTECSDDCGSGYTGGSNPPATRRTCGGNGRRRPVSGDRRFNSGAVSAVRAGGFYWPHRREFFGPV